jgi:isopenicillin N synthase-like dioxygenase
MTDNTIVAAKIICLPYADLLAGVDLSEKIGEAYGFDGIGLLTVSGVPGLLDARANLLPLARRFATLEETIQDKYVDEGSYYSFGWSLGKEKLEGKPDKSKGSYYANPQYDRPVESEEIIKKYPGFVTPNIWPTDEIPEFETHFKALGQLIVAVGKLVARQCDAYIKSQLPNYVEGRMQRIIDSSLCCKARLLHYFPYSGDEGAGDPSDFSSWCGWHNDHGSLTGLTSAMYLDAESGEGAANNDPSAGLYIRGRHGELIKAAFPADQLAFQIGETAQIHSGGLLQATPHAVRGSSDPKICRDTFAVFMEPNWDEDMAAPEGVAREDAQSQLAANSLPKGVPPLSSRWATGQTFGDFTEKTLSSYY